MEMTSDGKTTAEGTTRNGGTTGEGARGGGETTGSLDVLSLGCAGEITLEFDDIGLIDGEGPDLLVFENVFSGFMELGVVAASDDGKTWAQWDCDTEDVEGEHPGCAGVHPVLANPGNDLDATDPDQAGGDAFDLGEIGLKQARFVRITDAGTSDCAGTSGGFDLDAVAVVNGQKLP